MGTPVALHCLEDTSGVTRIHPGKVKDIPRVILIDEPLNDLFGEVPAR